MKIDAITIFPEYFAPLKLSLVGKAIADKVIDFSVHDLRDFTEDKHRSVDDAPFGGGAGMLMLAEPWGRALDKYLEPDSIVIFPTPAGEPFNQETAKQLATSRHLLFACGRYEGIDQRVIDYSHTKAKTLELSLGDYVLNGGEVAALAMIEAITRLIPGVLGNQESLLEESHESGLLEYPSYTKPANWRGFEVPEVLLSGHHLEIAKWRKSQAEARTRLRRPDLLG